MKSAYLIPLFCAVLLTSGCDDAESEVCRYYIQQDLDNANFESAINRLADKSCKETYPENEYLVDLSSAYLGKSGLTLAVIMRAIIEDDNSNEEFSFENFIAEITKSAKSSALSDLNASRSALDEYLNNNSCKSIKSPTSAQETVCLITGFIDVLKTTMAVDTLTGGNVDSWIANGVNGENDSSMLRASCALQYSYDHKNDTTFSIPYNQCEPGVSIDNIEDVTFTSDNGDKKTYNSLSISYDNESEYFLESTTLGSTIFTKDYCQIDYAVCNDIEQASCYACPLSQSAVDLNIQGYLLESLNSGFDSIEAVIVNSSEGQNGEIQKSIDQFILEIKPAGCSAILTGEDCFTMDDIINYLNRN